MIMCQLNRIEREVIMNMSLLAIDLAKTVFQLHGVDERGHPVLRKSVSRAKLAQQVQNLPP